MQSRIRPPGATAGHEDPSTGATGRAGDAAPIDVATTGEATPAGARTSLAVKAAIPRPRLGRLTGAQLDLPLMPPPELADADPGATLERRAIEALPHAVAVYDGERRYRLLNGRGAQLFGLAQAQAVGRRDEELCSPERAAHRIAALERALATGVPQRFEDTAELGGRRLALMVDVLPRRRGPSVSELVLVAVDVTEDKQLEGALGFLSDANEVLAGSLEHDVVAEDVARLALPLLGDACAIVVRPTVGIPVVAVAHVSPERESFARLALGPVARRLADEMLASESDDEDPRVLCSGEGDFDALGASPDERAQLDALGVRSWLLVPLRARGRCIGAASFVGTDSGGSFGSHGLAVAEAFTRRAAVSLDNARLYRLAHEQMQSAERAAVRIAALQAITAALASALTPAEVGEVVVREGLLALGAAACALALPRPDGATLEVVHSAGYGPELLDALVGSRGSSGSVCMDAYRTGTAVFLDEPSEWRRRYPGHAAAHAAPGLGAGAAVPLALERHVLGVLVMSFGEDRRLSHDDGGFLRAVAGQAAQALERARLYQAEHRARAEAQEANAAKDQFLAMVSHELRNPLTAVQTGVEVLRRQGVLTGRAARALDIIDRNAKLQGRLVNDLLDLSRLTRGKMQLQRAPLALASVVRSACQAYEAEAEEAGIAYRIDASAELWVHGDFDRLEQVVHNLVSNAIKFTPGAGEVTVSIERTERAGEGFARIVVTDTGVGIEAARLPILFEMFQQGEVGAKRRPGLGIGLTLVRSIVERHGGRVWAESAGTGRGSRFTVELPQIAAPRDEARPVAASPAGLAVLVVEDNPDTRSLLADGLGMMGYRVATAASGEDALAYLERTRPDVVLADIGLPGLDGFELMRRARALPGMEHVIAFAVTGYGAEDDVRRGREAGFSGHFVKPVDIAVLDRRIRERIPQAVPAS